MVEMEATVALQAMPGAVKVEAAGQEAAGSSVFSTLERLRTVGRSRLVVVQVEQVIPDLAKTPGMAERVLPVLS